MKKLYIGECDENGDVCCVWVSSKHRRPPQVFNPKKHIFDPQEMAEFSGPNPQRIVEWLVSQQKQGPNVGEDDSDNRAAR